MPTEKESRIVSRGCAPASKFISLAPPTIIEQIDHRFGPTLYKLPGVTFPRESSLLRLLGFGYILIDKSIFYLIIRKCHVGWREKCLISWQARIFSINCSVIVYWNINPSFKLVTVAGKRKTKQFPMHAPIYMWHTPAGNKGPLLHKLITTIALPPPCYTGKELMEIWG